MFNIISFTLKDQWKECVLLHTPAIVWHQRGLLNQEIDDFIAQYLHIKNVYEGAKGRTIYDPLNNIFVELQQLQRRMEFYNIILEECKGVLKFVVKLDECEIVKEKKIERLTILFYRVSMHGFGGRSMSMGVMVVRSSGWGRKAAKIAHSA